MPRMFVERKIDVKANPRTVFPYLNDLEKWQLWSPWLIMDPATEVKIASDHKSYSWVGKRTGEGEMKILSEKENEQVEYDLRFIKPWKSQADVKIRLKEAAEGTEVSWTMESSLPFFLFWMKKMMEAFVGMDFMRGLHMLKDLSEESKVNSKLDFEGQSTFEGCDYIGIKNQTTMSRLGEDMSQDFERLEKWASENKEHLTGEPFSLYHKWDMVKGKVVYTSGFMVKNDSVNVPSDFVKGNIPKTRVNVIKHTGPYHHLGNAWSSQHSMLRAKEFKLNKKIPGFETYQNRPGETPENQLSTRIYFPIK